MSDAYSDLAAGRLDAVLADQFQQWEWIKNGEGGRFEFKGQPIDVGLNVGIAVRKNDNLRDKLNEALRELISDGTFKK